MTFSLARQIQNLKDKCAENEAVLEENSEQHTQMWSEINVTGEKALSKIYARASGDSKSGEGVVVEYSYENSRNEVTHNPLIDIKNIATTSAEVTTLKASPVGMSTIFNSWYRFSHWRGEQNLSGNTGHKMTNQAWSGVEHATARNAWSYDPSTNMIKSNRNSPVYAGFISDRKLSAYYILVRCDGGGDSDNDGILINLAFMTDTSGVQHTIDLVKARMGTGNVVYLDETGMEFYWSIVYDYRKTTQVELATNSYVQPVSGGWGNNFVLMSAKRIGDTLECYCSDWNSEVIDTRTVINYTCPTTQPANLNATAFANVEFMLRNPAQMGVGAHSQNGLFTILDQKYIFDDAKIYDIASDTIWVYDEVDGQWYEDGSVKDTLRDGSLYFNRQMQKLYYYTNGDMIAL